MLDDGWLFVWATENFEKILDGYTWRIGNKRYTFKTHRIYDEDILNNKLAKYDAIMVGATDEFAKIGIWKKLHPRKHET